MEEPSVIAAHPPLSKQVELSGNERILEELFRQKQSPVPFCEIEEMCRNAGMKDPTVASLVCGSPIVVRCGPGLYALVGDVAGWETEPRPVVARRLNRALVDYGQLSDRLFWLIYKVSEGMIRHGCFYVPAQLLALFKGDSYYSLTTSDDARIGRLVFRGCNGRGLRPFFRSRGGNVGDRLFLIVDVGAHEATVDLRRSGSWERLAGTEAGEVALTASPHE